MAITNGYLTLAEALSDLGIGDTEDDPRVERAIVSASRQIDRHCGQRFWQDGSATTRYFTPHDRHVLRFLVGSGDHNAATATSVTSVEVDSTGDGTFDLTFTAGTDFFLAPRGAPASSRPYDRLQLLTLAGNHWPVGVPDAVKVVGTFGWSSVPPEVKEATAIQTQVLFKRATEGAAPIVTMDGVTLQGGSRFLDRNAQLLLQGFRMASYA